MEEGTVAKWLKTVGDSRRRWIFWRRLNRQSNNGFDLLMKELYYYIGIKEGDQPGRYTFSHKFCFFFFFFFFWGDKGEEFQDC